MVEFRQFQAPNITGLVNTVQGLELNRMRSQQLQGDEGEKNAMRALFADPNFNPSDPAQARRILAVAPRTGHATFSALLRGYADQRAADASVRAGAAAARQAELANAEIEIKNFDLQRQALIGIGQLPEAEKPAAWAAWRAQTEARLPRTRGYIPREYSPGAYTAMLSSSTQVVNQNAERNKPAADFTLRPGEIRFNAAGQPIASSEARDPTREVKIRDIMETQNIPRSVAVGIVDGVLRPIQDPTSGQTRLFNLANNTFVEFAPANAPAAPASAPAAPAPMTVGPRVGVAPPPNAVVAEPANAMLASPGAAAAQPNAIQLPPYVAPTTRPEADYQKRVLDLMANVEQARIADLRARTSRREDAAAIAAEKGAEAEAIARGQSNVRRADQPARVEEAGQTAGAVAGAQANVRRAEQPARVEEAGQTAGAQTTGRLEAEDAVKRRQDAERLDFAIREIERLTRRGGLLELSTGSGVGAGVDWLGGQVGFSTRASRAAAAIPPIADLALKMVPRFEGPQSENDRKSYEKAAGNLADSTQPNADRLAAAREVLRIMRARRDQFTVSGAPTPSAAAPTAAPAAPTAPPVPQGLDMTPDNWSRLWGVMTPQERALWQN